MPNTHHSNNHEVQIVVEASPPVTSSATAAQTPAPAVDDSKPKCLVCHQSPIEYASSTCHHALFCKKCAMKCATGGKCKICGELFPDLRRI